MGFVGLPLIIALILLTAAINLFIAVDSAKWAIMAPVFVPMFMCLGMSPELTQAAYRIGDSCTNIIAPTMLPYSLGFLIGWLVLFVIWYVLGLPLGPGSPMFYPA